MHNGDLATLEDVARRHPTGNALSDDDVRDLVAFLESLSEKATAGGK
jgi:cytochrome c1